MRRPIALAVLALLCVAAGCGGGGSDTPVACLEGSSAYLGALARAPGKVRLAGDVPISECLVKNQAAGELATVGTAMLESATRLNSEARSEGGGSAAVRLGYLIGAARSGAEDTSGIHVDLLRRLESAARFSPGGRPLPAAFRAAYREGLEAGMARG